VTTKINPLAGQPAGAAQRIDVAKLVAAYYDLHPDPAVAAERVAFGTSGHRGSSFERSFNEAHVLAITQAIVLYRRKQGIDGPLFIGVDTHALSRPAFESALEVLAANGIETRISKGGEYTPTPAVSHAILVHNRGRRSAFADGIVVTPSHNPPDNGGFKYNPPNGGPADTAVTGWIEIKANGLLEAALKDVRRTPIDRARNASTTHEHDFLTAYVDDLRNVIDFDPIRESGLRMGVDPLGGAGVHYWGRIAERYAIDLTVVSTEVDPMFSFMTLDWDGRIRMDPSSAYAMRRLIGLKDRYDIAFACDTDHDRHGIVTRADGLMPSNDYLAVAADYLCRNRPRWSTRAAIGKTTVTSALLDRVARRHERKLYEVPVGFKWFVDELLDGSLGFGCEESAGASFDRLDGSVWTTDKDGIVPSLLAAEMTARSGRDPAVLYRDLTANLGVPYSDRIEAAATSEQKQRLARLKASDVRIARLAGERIDKVLDHAPGNGAPIGGIKAVAASGWFAARPSGTEPIYKIYAESFRDRDHLEALLREAQGIVDRALEPGAHDASSAKHAPSTPARL
jgi:phosphoglucomutase